VSGTERRNPPVTDWSTEYDLRDPAYVADPYDIWRDLRSRCPVATTDRLGGSVLPTRYDDVVAVAHDTATFSSVDTAVFPRPAGASPFVAPPITSDPPFHAEARRILLPHFGLAAVTRLEARTREIVTELLDGLEGRAEADAAADFAEHVPVRVIAHLLGIPADDEPRFTDWVVRVLQDTGPDTERTRATATRELLAYFGDVVAARRVERGDDLVSALLDAELDGAPLTDKHLQGTCALLLLAGIDTTWSMIASSLAHLARTPADRDRLVTDPSLLPQACEEFLRAFAPVTQARIATDDTEIAGCPVTAGSRVLLVFGAANRDPSHFDRPDVVDIDRTENRHLAFGVGIHRCIGSNLARMELQVAIGGWLERFPGFHLRPDATVTWTGEQIRSPHRVPVRLR